MIDNLITYALRHKLLSLSAALLWISVGIVSVMHLAVDSFPDVSNVQVQIITEPETMPTEEVEALVTFPIENSLNGLPNISTVRSNSSFGLSVVTAIFEDSTDVYWARNVVQQRLSSLILPPEVPKPVLGPVISTFSNVLNYYVTSPTRSLIDLRTIEEWDIALPLRAVHGVANVATYGGFAKEYQVQLKPAALRGYGLSVQGVSAAIAANNENAGGKFIERAGEELIIRGVGRIQSVGDIEDIVLKSVGGTPVKVSDVADVTIGPAFRRGASSVNGNDEAVSAMIFARKGANSKEVVEKVLAKLKQIQADLPSDVQIHVYYDQAHLVDNTIHTVREVLTVSSSLVTAVLFALLLDIRCSLIVAVIIPMSLLCSFTLMNMSGLSANIMTLGAVDFGVIVDAGVVMVENIFRHLARANAEKRTDSRFDIVVKAATEVGRPIVFSITIIVAVFIPLFALSGIEGRMFHPLAMTYIFALLGALLVALVFIPLLCLAAIGKNPVEKEHPVLNSLRHRLQPVLDKSFQRPFMVTGIAVAMMAVSLLIIPFLGSEFVPTLDEGSILLRTKLIPSVALSESCRVVSQLEKVLCQFKQVDVIVARIGRSGQSSDLEGVENADIYIGLNPKNTWNMNKVQLVDSMAKEVSKIPGLKFSFSQPIADMIDDLVSGVRADVGIKIFGRDLAVLDDVAKKIESVAATTRGASDLQREHILGLPQLEIKLRRHDIARYGLNVADVLDIVRIAIAGKVVTEVIDTPKHFGLMVRYPLKDRDTIADLQEIMVDTHDGAQIPMKDLVDMKVENGVVMVNREDGERRTAVLVNVRGRDLGSFVEELRSKVARDVPLPKGVRIVWGGQFENQERAMNRLAIVVPIVLVIIFFLLYATLNSFRNAALVMLSVPFSMVGGIFALFLSQQVLSVPAIIGFIALFGVAVQNGVILVTYIDQKQRAGMSVQDAAELGAEVRLRPVLMTALVAIVGFTPLLLSQGTGAEVQRPLATVVTGGLLTATPLTLILLPTLYVVFNRPRQAVDKAEEKKEAEEVSPP